MVEIPAIITERVFERNLSKFSLKTKAKDFRSWLIGQIQRASFKKDVETELIMREVKRAYDSYCPEITKEVGIEGWHGKSSFDIVEEPDRYIIIKFQRKQRGEEPKEIRFEATKHEMNLLRNSIKYKWEKAKETRDVEKEGITTKEVAMEYCYRAQIDKDDKGRSLFRGDDFWTNFFGWRIAHNKFTIMLNCLREWKEIEYSGGGIWVI